MALVIKDRVRVTSATTGTGTFTLGSAASGYQDFSVIGDGNTTYYAIQNSADNTWEVGIGTYTASGTTLSRDTVLESSNSGSLVNFGSGTKDVFVTYPAEKSIYKNASDVANITSTDVTTALGYTPVTDARTLTVNGTSYDLTANRTWSVGTVTSVAALTLGTTGTDLSSTVADGTTTPVITLNVPTASSSNRGVLSSTDWSTFNGKQAALVSGTNIKTVNGTTLLGSGDLGTISIEYGGTGQTTRQAAMDALAGAVTSGSYLRGDGTDVVMSTIQAGDVPTLNQNTTGTAAGLSATLAVSSGGTGQTTYTNGQLLIGNTTGNTLTKATLTAGAGTTITNGSGSITIAPDSGYNGFGARTVSTGTPTGGSDGDIWYKY